MAVAAGGVQKPAMQWTYLDELEAPKQRFVDWPCSGHSLVAFRAPGSDFAKQYRTREEGPKRQEGEVAKVTA